MSEQDIARELRRLVDDNPPSPGFAERLAQIAPGTLPARRSRLLRGRTIAVACSVLAVAAIAAAAVVVSRPGADTHPASPTHPAAPTDRCPTSEPGALSPTAGISHMTRSAEPQVPALPTVPDAGDRLVPEATPTQVAICLWTGRESERTVSERMLTGNLTPIAVELSNYPPPVALRACGQVAIGPGYEPDFYLMRLNYPSGTVWVAAPQFNCAGSTNGIFDSGANPPVASWYDAGHWVADARPGVQGDPCGISQVGRLGQEEAMAPGNPVAVVVCQRNTTERSKAVTDRATITRLQQVLNSPVTMPVTDAYSCAGPEIMSSWAIELYYAQGTGVSIGFNPSCNRLSNDGVRSAPSPQLVPLLTQIVGQK